MSTSNRGRGARGGRVSDRGRGGTNAKTPRNTVISTSGVFSEGAGDSVSRQSKIFRSDNSSTASSLRRPTLNVKHEKIDPQAEKKRIAEIYDLDEDFGDDEPAQDITSDPFSPIILRQSKSFNKKKKNSFELNSKLYCCSFVRLVKSVTKLENRVSSMEIKSEMDTKPNSTTNSVYPNSLDEFFDRTTPQLFLLQVKIKKKTTWLSQFVVAI